MGLNREALPHSQRHFIIFYVPCQGDIVHNLHIAFAFVFRAQNDSAITSIAISKGFMFFVVGSASQTSGGNTAGECCHIFARYQIGGYNVNDMSISQEIKELILINYPNKGKKWCMDKYGLSEGQIRSFCAKNKIKLNKKGDFFIEFQKKAAFSKIGKKRPSQSSLLKKMWDEGKIKVKKGKDNPRWNRIERICFHCNKKYETQPSHFLKYCSAECKKLKQKDIWKTNPHPKGMLGKKKTKKSIEKQILGIKSAWKKKSDAEIGIITKKIMKTKMKNGNLYNPRNKVSWKASWATIGDHKKAYYRSKWEKNYAYYLEWLKIRGDIKDWKHEPKTFWFDKIKRGCVSYLPDFVVIENDDREIYHEVKGWMDDRSVTKIKRMAKYYPNVILIVIDAKEYKKLSNSIGKIVPGWEI